ncbi:MAG: hypothetical protein SPF08_11390 [Candidatus Flemingibacterium sp.]|nr:hypothetical protein [Candidatus Flemingibacterium sp.]
MKKQRLTQLICLMLAAMMLPSCGGTANDVSKYTSASSDTTGETTPAVTGRDAVSDDLPDMNYNGKTFTLMYRSNYKYEFEAEEETGDLVNDAIYRRNGKVMDRFGVEFEHYAVDGSWYDPAIAFNTTVRSSIMSGDGAFDLVAGYAAVLPMIVGDNLFLNWNDQKYVDFSKPWWSERVADELTINGKDFLITGDLSLALWRGMNCIYFNKRLAEDYKTGDLYQLVKDGDWTFDKLISLSKDVYEDLDGDSKASEADKFGLLLGWATEIDNIKEAFEIHVAKKGADGFPEITLVDEHTVEVVERLNDYVHNSKGVYTTGGAANDREVINTAFRNGNGLFYTATLGKSEQMRDMNDDFGILPYPKYNDAQKEYHSTSLDEFSFFVIPSDAKDPDMSALITEALCAESYKEVIPVFYDTALKTKAARDDNSGEMIDIIRDSLTFDFGYIYSQTLGGVGHKFVGWIRDNNNNIVSDYESSEASIKSKLETVLEVYR